MLNYGAASSQWRNLAIGGGQYSQVLPSRGGTISRIHIDQGHPRTKGTNRAQRPCFSKSGIPRERRVTTLSPSLGKDQRCGRCRGGPRQTLRAKPARTAITKLRFPNRKTRPSVKTVITMGLRKNAPGGNRCREGDAYSAQIRQSRCHRAGISFV